MGLFKRIKYIKVPFERTADTTPFQVFQILTEAQKRKYQRVRFASPIFGTHVKDEVVIPILDKQRRDMEKMDPFRIKPKLTNEERIKRYGTAYPEFDVIKGKNLNEALEDQDSRINRVKPSVQSLPPEDFFTPEPTVETPTIHDMIEQYQDTETPPVEEKITPDFFVDDDEPLEETEALDSFDSDEEIIDDPLDEVEETFTEEDAFEEDGPEPLPSLPDAPVQHLEKPTPVKPYELPGIHLFQIPSIQHIDPTESLERQKSIINQTFIDFGVAAHVHSYTHGPTVTRYEVVLESGVRINKVTGLQDNLKMNLSAEQIRLEAPIPGKSTVGIEVPNEIRRIVHYVDLIKKPEFKESKKALTVALGQDIDGFTIVESIKEMPHGLVAGQTGSGKSVNINTILISLLLKYTPEELKMILIDPKMVELSSYDELPHLLTPVITNVKAATAALKWTVDEMERRYQVFSDSKVRDIDTYNEVAHKKIPLIVIVVDELADLMMAASQAVEESIMRITQKARAAGIHLLVATQRPSTDVIKGTIKSNIPSRIAFSVASHIDSQTILDSAGAEKLIGKGDMLLMMNGKNKRRLQGAFVSDQDIHSITEFIKQQRPSDYLFTADELIEKAMNTFENDELLVDVAKFVITTGEASMNKIIKAFGIGFNRAQSIVNSLEAAGIVSENLGSRAREVLVDEDEAQAIIERLRGI
jgi:S-DNA-T family DNA segregation ATPase FtsK/SpoIIIE